MSGWWFAAISLGLFLLLWGVMDWRWKRRAVALALSRTNVGREQFTDLLASDCEADIADFLWDVLAPEWAYWNSGLTPHPDDDYLAALPIDPDEQEDWVRDFCDLNGLQARDWPDWPENRNSTVRNLARWLSEGRQLLARVAA